MNLIGSLENKDEVEKFWLGIEKLFLVEYYWNIYIGKHEISIIVNADISHGDSIIEIDRFGHAIIL